MLITNNPCVACGKQETIGVVYGYPDEVKFWCSSCLPEEFRPKVRQRSDQDMFDAWADIEADRERKNEAQEAKLRGDANG